MAFKIQHKKGCAMPRCCSRDKKNSHHRKRHILSLFVHTLSFSATIVFDIDTVQMHNSTTDTIKDTYYFSKSIQQILTICMFDFFFLLLNINMFVLHLSLQCPTDKFRDPSTHRGVWKSMASHFPSVVGNFWKVMTGGEAGHCQHLFPSCPGAV